MKIFRNSFNGIEFSTHHITNTREALKVVSSLNPRQLYGLDIETAKIPEFKDHTQAGLDPRLSYIRLIQVYDGDKTVYVFDLFAMTTLLVQCQFCDFLSSKFVAHNGIFEISHLWKFTNNNKPLDINCSMLLSQLVDGAEHSVYEPEETDDEPPDGLSKYKRRSHSLDAVVQRLMGVKVEKALQTSDWSLSELSTEQINYAALDAVLTYKVAEILKPKLVEYKMVKIYKLLKKMQQIVAKMQLNGLPVDWEYHGKLIEQWTTKSEESLVKCRPFFGDVNLRSTQQLGVWLPENVSRETLLSWPRTEKDSYSFDQKQIAEYSYIPPIAALLEYKKYAKLLSTYGESLLKKKHPVTGRLHASYTLGQTRTGRLSSFNPNCQNMPNDPEFRRMFKAPEGYTFVVGDFSQIEVRLQAEFSKDPVMMKAYREKEDIYETMASSYYGIPAKNVTKEQRELSKMIVLSLGYGMSAKTLGVKALNESELTKPQEYWNKAHKAYHTIFKVYSKWCERMRSRTEKLGYIETLYGKRRRLLETEIYTRAPNTVIQGTAAELIEETMLLNDSRLGNLGDTISTVHDEIICLCTEEKAMQVKACLETSMCDIMRSMFPNAVSFDVAKVKIGKTWAEAK